MHIVRYFFLPYSLFIVVFIFILTNTPSFLYYNAVTDIIVFLVQQMIMIANFFLFFLSFFSLYTYPLAYAYYEDKSTAVDQEGVTSLNIIIDNQTSHTFNLTFNPMDDLSKEIYADISGFSQRSSVLTGPSPLSASIHFVQFNLNRPAFNFIVLNNSPHLSFCPTKPFPLQRDYYCQLSNEDSSTITVRIIPNS